MRKSLFAGCILWIGTLLLYAQRGTGRNLEFQETIRLSVPAGSRSVKVWVPTLAEEEFQSAELIEFTSPVAHRLTRDPDFGNKLIYLEWSSGAPQVVEIRTRYRVRRKEQAVPLFERAAVPLFTRPRGLVVVNEEIRGIARQVAGELGDPTEKARAFYYYVLNRMDYDKSGEGWGRGDVLYACRVGKGNCTDFHSLFMALSLAEGIPVRFRMGYSVPAAPEGELLSYHCWAEFFVEGRGWIPVDISEAWKRPAKADYYFGRLDPDRIAVSTGRELRLSPPQEGPSLNYLFRPYVEVNGAPYDDFEWQRRYKEII